MPNIPTNLHSLADDIVEHFDFANVQKVMQFLNWTWASTAGVPSIEKLKETARYVLDSAITEYEKRGFPDTGMYCETGGFRATISKFASGDAHIDLLFYTECSWRNFK